MWKVVGGCGVRMQREAHAQMPEVFATSSPRSCVHRVKRGGAGDAWDLGSRGRRSHVGPGFPRGSELFGFA